MKKLLINRTVKVRWTHAGRFEPPIGVADYGCLDARAGTAPSEPPETVRLFQLIEFLRNLAKKFLAIVGARLPVAAGLRFSSSHQDHPSFTGHVGAGEVERERA
jgi:hypothetical protein